jgi:CO/xanthine dehydrogenase Mo-binding subunit
VLTNNAFTCAVRGFGVNQAAFAVEQQMNKAALELGLSPSEIRQRNLVRGPTVLGGGSELNSEGGLLATLQMATEAAERMPLASSDDTVAYGRGMAVAVKNFGFGFGFDDSSTAEVTLTADAAIVCVGAAEVGQGSETTLIQIAASVLGVHPDAVRLEWRDTHLAPDAGASSASRQTVASGNAVIGACERVLRLVNEAGGLEHLPGACASARFTWRFPSTTAFGQRPALHLSAFGWATCVADISVDRGTGAVTLLRVVNALDAGRVVNPALLQGQIEGGIVMGQGYALQERFYEHAGMPLTLSFESCGVPTALDAAPIIEALVVEVPEVIGPFGARGAGEIVMIPVVPAIIAAIHAACGVWVDELPALPDRVLAAIGARGEGPG